MNPARRKFVSFSVMAFVGASLPIGYRYVSCKSKDLPDELVFATMRMDIQAGFKLDGIPLGDLLAFYRGEHSPDLYARFYTSVYLVNRSLLSDRSEVEFGMSGYLFDPTLAEVIR